MQADQDSSGTFEKPDAQSEVHGVHEVPDTVMGVTQELLGALSQIVRGEIRLAKAELTSSVKHVKNHAAATAIFVVIAVLGIFPLLAFLVIGTSHLLNDNYVLGSLIVTLVMVGGGGLVAYLFFRKMNVGGLSLPTFRNTLSREGEEVRDRFVHLRRESTQSVREQVDRLPIRDGHSTDSASEARSIPTRRAL